MPELGQQIVSAYHTKIFADSIRFRLDTQLQSYLKDTVNVQGGLTGNLHQIQGIGNPAWRPATRFQPIPDTATEFPQRWLAPKPLHEIGQRYSTLDTVMLQLDPGSKLAEGIIISAFQYIDDIIIGFPGELGGFIGSVYEGQESNLQTVALPATSINDGSDSTVQMSYERILEINSIFDQKKVPRGLMRWGALTPIAFRQLYNNGPSMTNGRWGNADETQLQLIQNGQIGRIAGINLRLTVSQNAIASNAVISPGRAPVDTDYCVFYTADCLDLGQWGPFSPEITVSKLMNESQQPYLVYGQIMYGSARYMDSRVIRADVDVSST